MMRAMMMMSGAAAAIEGHGIETAGDYHDNKYDATRPVELEELECGNQLAGREQRRGLLQGDGRRQAP
jgi:hypothetical protein